ncbi:MAG: class II glutamine amidotransferase, partial [Candidatus Levybacteria bacterium]|nr:class II glutamine amidotransferase [Candidatus Levybacteria bacterium]
MCGIFGYIGKQNNAAEIVLEGLRLLEYRGYDSWGIAVLDNKKLAIEKHAGKIGNAKTSLPKSTMGIGHTRWATHGGVSDKNAHPHFDCTKEIAVLHNGIIENYAEIKEVLQKKGHTFISETDTEVFAHLVEENLKKESFATSVRDAFNQIHGLNAVVVAYAPSKE